jgi:succinate dehydrogenase / fumarate reductase flavoprotein subunit
MALNAKIPHGEMKEKWEDYKGHVKLVNPANKRKIEVIVVGTGPGGCFCSCLIRRNGV